MAWFIGQSTLVIVLAFGLGLAVGWLLWARRMRLLTVEIVAARIRAAEQAASRAPYGRRITFTSSGRIALDAHTPLGGDNVRPRSPATDLDEMCHDIDEHNGGHRREPGVVDPARGHDDHAGHSGLHIPAPRIEPSDIADRDELDFDGFDGDDDLDDDASDLTIDDDFGTRFEPRFFPRLGHQRSTSDLRGLDRFRDLFTPTNGRTPQTPEPQRSEPDLTPARDIDGGPSPRARTGGDSADDTTLAAAGLAGDSAVGPATGDAGDSTPESDAGHEFPESDNMPADATRPVATPSVDNRLAPAEASVAPDAAERPDRAWTASSPQAAAGLSRCPHLAALDQLSASRIATSSQTALHPSRRTGLTSSVHGQLRAGALASRPFGAQARRGPCRTLTVRAPRVARCTPPTDTVARPGAIVHLDQIVISDRGPRIRWRRSRSASQPFLAQNGGRRARRRAAGWRRMLMIQMVWPASEASSQGHSSRSGRVGHPHTFGRLANADGGWCLARRSASFSRTWQAQPASLADPARLLATADEDRLRRRLARRLITGHGLDDERLFERSRDGIGPQTLHSLASGKSPLRLQR